MSDRARARHRRRERAEKRTRRWESEYVAARTVPDRLNIAYRWCLAEMRRQKQGSVFGRVDAERFEPAIEALIKAARGGDPT